MTPGRELHPGIAEELVVLVDAEDNELGLAPKLEVHRDARLHRAVSVFVANPSGDMLLQQRAQAKYHSGGLWSNACCSHPRPGEDPQRAASRRLYEEMGIGCPLSHAFSFVYRARLGAGMTEHELDHVFVGIAASTPAPDPNEVAGWRWVPVDEVKRELESRPERFTAWFPLAFHELMRRGLTG